MIFLCVVYRLYLNYFFKTIKAPFDFYGGTGDILGLKEVPVIVYWSFKRSVE